MDLILSLKRLSINDLLKVKNNCTTQSVPRTCEIEFYNLPSTSVVPITEDLVRIIDKITDICNIGRLCLIRKDERDKQYV